MKKIIAFLLLLTLLVSVTACSGNSASSGGDAPNNGDAPAQESSTPAEADEPADGEEAADPIDLVCWVNEEHVDIFETGEKLYNEQHPQNPIKLSLEFYPVAEMHNKLLIALQSGVGAPDIVDINLTWWSNFLQGDVQLVPLNDIVEPELDHVVTSRFDLDAKDGT